MYLVFLLSGFIIQRVYDVSQRRALLACARFACPILRRRGRKSSARIVGKPEPISKAFFFCIVQFIA